MQLAGLPAARTAPFWLGWLPCGLMQSLIGQVTRPCILLEIGVELGYAHLKTASLAWVSHRWLSLASSSVTATTLGVKLGRGGVSKEGRRRNIAVHRRIQTRVRVVAVIVDLMLMRAVHQQQGNYSRMHMLYCRSLLYVTPACMAWCMLSWASPPCVIFEDLDVALLAC
jgi:hypothetical protein